MTPVFSLIVENPASTARAAAVEAPVVSATPTVAFTPLGFVGVIGGSFWIPIAAVFLYLRGNQPVAGAPAVVTTAPAA